MGKGKGLITKGRYELQFRGTECRNCGHLLDVSDRYCPSCGQANSTKKLVLKDFFDEFFSSLINYDSKLIKTLYTMLIKPGTITRDYINGKRISYTNPFRFLLSLAFLYFLMVSYDSGFSSLDDAGFKDKIKKTGPFSFSYDTDETKNDSITPEERIAVMANLDSLENIKGIPSIQNLDSVKTIIQEGIKKENRKDSLIRVDPKKYFTELQNKNSASIGRRMEFFFTMLQRDSIKTFEDARVKLGAQDNWKNRLTFNSSKSTLKAIAKPGSYLNNTISKLPLVIFLFLPLFTIFVLLVYIRKKYTYTDHLIFSFHNQSVLFILLILSWVIDSVFKTTTAWIAITFFSIYLFQAMKKFYSQGIFKTIIKYVFLNTAFVFLAIICATLLFTGSIFTY